MRSLCTWLSTAVLTAAVVGLVPGCDGGPSELEKPPENPPSKAMNPETDMPGYKDMQNSIKANAKTPKK